MNTNDSYMNMCWEFEINLEEYEKVVNLYNVIC